VKRLGVISLTISDEIKDQNRMLESMETDMDASQTQLDLLTEKTKELITKAGYLSS
jgi:uncharacterized coiled-coil protein SlyX